MRKTSTYLRGNNNVCEFTKAQDTRAKFSHFDWRPALYNGTCIGQDDDDDVVLNFQISDIIKFALEQQYHDD